MITIELFGVPRLRAGTGLITLYSDIAGFGEALDRLARYFPMLDGKVIQRPQGQVHPAYRLCLNGDRFVTDPATPLREGDTLLLFAADVGG